MTERDICERLRAARRVINTDPYGNRISAEPVELYREAADEIERLRAALADGWEPIETAPQMKTILLFAVTDTDEDGHVRNWKMGSGFWRSGYADHRDMSPWQWGGRQLAKYDVQPTHWRPLPEPPSPQPSSSQGNPEARHGES